MFQKNNIKLSYIGNPEVFLYAYFLINKRQCNIKRNVTLSLVDFGSVINEAYLSLCVSIRYISK